MATYPDRFTDLGLLKAALAFVAHHPDRAVDHFREAVSNWGQQWCGVTPAYLPASDRLEHNLGRSSPETEELMSAFTRQRASLHWEQAYAQTDNTVDDHMLANYGYAEIIGKQGPFLSTRIRAGIAVYGPGISYPLHRHQAEEIYVVLAGAAEFRLGDEAPVTRTPGAVIHHEPMMGHGLDTGENTLVIFYVWQGGDLREKPTFI